MIKSVSGGGNDAVCQVEYDDGKTLQYFAKSLQRFRDEDLDEEGAEDGDSDDTSSVRSPRYEFRQLFLSVQNARFRDRNM